MSLQVKRVSPFAHRTACSCPAFPTTAHIRYRTLKSFADKTPVARGMVEDDLSMYVYVRSQRMYNFSCTTAILVPLPSLSLTEGIGPSSPPEQLSSSSSSTALLASPLSAMGRRGRTASCFER